jgi:hypothetical protein
MRAAELRELIDSCEAVADDLDRGLGEPAVAVAEVVRLRQALGAHLRCGEPLVGGPIARIERRPSLANPVTAELHATLAALRAQLA